MSSLKIQSEPTNHSFISPTGAGKSTLAKAISAINTGTSTTATTNPTQTFTRLSIDSTIHARHGLYGIDYPAAAYAAHQEEAATIFRSETTRLLQLQQSSPATNPNLVLDRAFYAKADRDEYRALAEQAGARVVLVFLDASRDVLWRRIRERKAKARDADSAMDVTEDVLDAYLAGFERPDGEGELVISVT